MTLRGELSPDTFAEEYVKLHRLPTESEGTRLNWRAKYIMLSGYIFWACYVMALFFVGLYQPLVILMGLLLSPFLVAGVMYALTASLWYLLPKPNKSPESKISIAKNSKKGHTKQK